MTLPRPTAAPALAHRDAGTVERGTAALMAPTVGGLNAAVVQLLAAHPAGLTATETLDAYLTKHPGRTGLYSVAPRLSQLERLGWCEKAGHRTRDGERRRVVYRLTAVATEVLGHERLLGGAA